MLCQGDIILMLTNIIVCIVLSGPLLYCYFKGKRDGRNETIEIYEKINDQNNINHFTLKMSKELLMRVDECNKLKKSFKDGVNNMSILEKKRCKQAKKELKEQISRVINSED